MVTLTIVEKIIIDQNYLTDCGVEASGIKAYDEYDLFFEKPVVEKLGVAEVINPANVAKVGRLINEHISGHFEYDPSILKSLDKELYIEANNRPIRAATTEGTPDREDLMKTVHAEGIESDDMMVKGLGIGAFRIIALQALESKQTEISLNWLWCENSTWNVVYGVHVHKYTHGFDGSDPMRKMASVPNANHFVRLLLNCSFR